MSTYRDVMPYACHNCKLVTMTMLSGSGTPYDRRLYACLIDKMEELKVPYKTFGATPSECLHKEAHATNGNS